MSLLKRDIHSFSKQTNKQTIKFLKARYKHYKNSIEGIKKNVKFKKSTIYGSCQFSLTIYNIQT